MKKVIKMKKLTIAILFSGIGFMSGYFTRPVQIIKTEFKDRTVNVSVCDKAFSNVERAICFAKDSCNGMIDTFKYDSLNGKTDFNCKNNKN
jgi:hypothetical protein